MAKKHFSPSLPAVSFALALVLTLALALSLFWQSFDAQAKKRQGKNKAGEFDYYSLVLSWSPTFCDSNAGKRDRQQCGRNRRYAFVVHGLWPQYEKGWPQYCRVQKGNYYVRRNVIASMTDIMPSKRLVIHEWKKHGTCSGLANKDYFAITRQLFKSIKIPERYQRPNSFITTTPKQLEADFLKANKDLQPSMISVHCGRRKRLKEIRICFDKDQKLRPCGRNEDRECRARQLVLPPVR